jgi:hypothetical protein
MIALGSPWTQRGYPQLFVSQVVHGVIAASISYLTLGLIATRIALPQLVRASGLPDLRPALKRERCAVNWHVAVLGLAPPVALILVALLFWLRPAQGASVLYFALGGFGALSFAMALWIAPVIRTTLTLLDSALASFERMLSK